MKYFFLWLALLLLLPVTTYKVQAQVVPSLQNPVRISAFTTFTDAKPDFRYYGDLAVYGFSAGVVVQTPHILSFGLPQILSFEARGSLLRSGGLGHQESALAGPRVALHFRSLSPYISVLGGAGNGWWWSNPPIKGLPKPKLEEGLGPQWSVLGGIDVHLHHRIGVRLGELSYSKIYAPGHTLTPLTASAGVLFRLN